jgi:hypothetical protein
MHELTQQSINNAEAKAKRAEQEFADVSKFVEVNGPTKTVRLVHDADGRAIGALINERSN